MTSITNQDTSKDLITVSWHIEDVHLQAKRNGKTITDEQARDILQAVKRQHDCNYGITWDTLDAHLDAIV